MTGGGGRVSAAAASVESLVIGDARVEKLTVMVAGPKWGRAMPPQLKRGPKIPPETGSQHLAEFRLYYPTP